MISQFNYKLPEPLKTLFEQECNLDEIDMATMQRSLLILYTQGLIPQRVLNKGIALEEEMMPEGRGRKTNAWHAKEERKKLKMEIRKKIIKLGQKSPKVLKKPKSSKRSAA